MRGGSLSHQEVLKSLKPFIVATWNGRPGTEPEDVKAAKELAKPGGRNISCMIFDSGGKFAGAFWPMPDGEPMGSAGAVTYVKKRIEELSSGLAKPESKKTGLTLPTAEGAGVRIFLSLKASGRGPGNYKAPTVEAVTTTDVERKALVHPSAARDVKAEELKRWLGQLYPAAIMDSSGKLPEVSGTLRLAPAGGDGKKRYATLKGEVRFQMDDKAATKYSLALEAVLTYDSGQDFVSLRAALDGIYPKADPHHQKPVEFRMTAVIESTPE